MEYSDSTEAFTIKIDGHEFQPAMTYQIFDDEKIFGHVEPHISLSFNSQYTPLYEFGSKEQEPHATDIKAALEKFSGPAGVFSRKDWEASPAAVAPVGGGETIAEWGKYSVRKYKPSQLAQAGNLLTKLQIFVVLFIEGGSYIDQDDEKWDIYFLMQGSKVLGLCTVYPYLYYSSGASFDANIGLKRTRISQFLVLPPYQRKGLGTRFLKEIYTALFSDPKVMDITVEDATEDFDTLRERVCLELYADIFNGLPDSPDDKELAAAATVAKTNMRALQQLYEMYWLQKHGEDSTLKLLIKTRIWRQSYLELKDVTTQERREKLDMVYQNVVKSYYNVISTEPSAKRQRSS